MIQNRSIPPSTVLPQIAYPDVSEAAAWLCAAFGFTPRLGIGNHRAQLNVGDGAIVVTEQRASEGPAPSRTLVSVMVRVEDLDAHCRHALQHGARIVRPAADYPYGERQYSAEDFACYIWTFTQSIADVDPVEWGGTPGRL